MSAGDIHRTLFDLPKSRYKTIFRSLLGDEWNSAGADNDDANAVSNTIADMAFGRSREVALMNNGKFVRIEQNNVLLILSWIPNIAGVSVGVFSIAKGISSDPICRFYLNTSIRSARKFLSGMQYAAIGATINF